MRTGSKKSSRLRAVCVAFAALVVAGLGIGIGPLVGEAEAIIGRPLTPMSYAGVARRTTRRAVYVGAAVSHPYPYPYYW